MSPICSAPTTSPPSLTASTTMSAATHPPVLPTRTPLPRAPLSQTFQDLSLRSPAWPEGSLPDNGRFPPLSKRQSPPQLLIPDNTSPGGADGRSLAPDSRCSRWRRRFNGRPDIANRSFPPVSGDGVTVENVPFQDWLGNFQAGTSTSDP